MWPWGLCCIRHLLFNLEFNYPHLDCPNSDFPFCLIGPLWRLIMTPYDWSNWLKTSGFDQSHNKLDLGFHSRANDPCWLGRSRIKACSGFLWLKSTHLWVGFYVAWLSSFFSTSAFVAIHPHASLNFWAHLDKYIINVQSVYQICCIISRIRNLL